MDAASETSPDPSRPQPQSPPQSELAPAEHRAPVADPLHERTRRHFFRDCGVGLGSIALASLLGRSASAASAHGRLPPLAAPIDSAHPVAPRVGHHPARAKRVIFLFMAGGPSQLELFDPKPKLQELDGQPIPASFMEGRRFAFMDTFLKETPKLLGTKRKFERHGQCGAPVSECLPHTAGVVDRLTFLKTVATDVPNHAPAKLYMNTGLARFGRPSMGSWITYGIGSEADDLPGFVVLLSGPRGPRGGAPNWGAGFLPSVYQGTPFRSGAEPILNLAPPPGVSPESGRRTLDAIQTLNRRRLEVTGDGEIAARIASYEMAFRMQSSAPDLVDLAGESAETLELYGVKPGEPSFAANCLLARRLVERGSRFVQLYHTNWDHHGGSTENLEGSLDQVCREIDRGCAALVTDLARRGLLDDTLVVWGGEFGRTPMGEIRDTVGRNHHILCSTMWMAGGGTKPGFTLGETDDIGFAPAKDPIHVHDVQATILHLLGLDHERLTYRFQGRDFRLTDVDGRVLHEMLA